MSADSRTRGHTSGSAAVRAVLSDLCSAELRRSFSWSSSIGVNASKIPVTSATSGTRQGFPADSIAVKHTHVCARVLPDKHVRSRGKFDDLVLDHDPPVPLHQQLTAMLRGQIERGEITGRVPSILTLAQEHEVSHRTAARALTTLRDEGLIISVTGKGYYVR